MRHVIETSKNELEHANTLCQGRSPHGFHVIPRLGLVRQKFQQSTKSRGQVIESGLVALGCLRRVSEGNAVYHRTKVLPYVDHLDDVEQTVDRSFQRGSCYWDHPRDSLDHRRDELDDLGSFGKKSR